MPGLSKWTGKFNDTDPVRLSNCEARFAGRRFLVRQPGCMRLGSNGLAHLFTEVGDGFLKSLGEIRLRFPAEFLPEL